MRSLDLDSSVVLISVDQDILILRRTNGRLPLASIVARRDI